MMRAMIIKEILASKHSEYYTRERLEAMEDAAILSVFQTIWFTHGAESLGQRLLEISWSLV